MSSLIDDGSMLAVRHFGGWTRDMAHGAWLHQPAETLIGFLPSRIWGFKCLI